MSDNPESVAAAEMAGEPSENIRNDAAPHKRRFAAYRLERTPETGDFYFIEEFEEWDRVANAYRLKRQKADIRLPADANRRLAADDRDFRQPMLELCNSLRRELDAKGVKIYFDIPKDDGGTMPVRAKWTYFLMGRRVDESLDFESLPDVREMVRPCESGKELWPLIESCDGQPDDDAFLAAGFCREDLGVVRARFSRIRDLHRKYGACRYYETRDWRVWFGKAMQLKREQVISGELERLCDARPAEVPFGEMADLPSGSRPAVPDAATRAKALADAADMIVHLMGGLSVPQSYGQAEIAADSHIMGLARSLLDLVFRKYGHVGSAVCMTDADVAEFVSGILAGIRVDLAPKAPKTDNGAGSPMKVGADLRIRVVSGDLCASIREIIEHAVSTANGASDSELNPNLTQLIGNRLEALLRGAGDGDTMAKFRGGIAEFDETRGELVVHDMTRLSQFIRKLYFGVTGETVMSTAATGERR
jgi:hypothetical protein